ncbi:hypothetical protein PIB30_092423 [Stylosanthes scabra]|uniref:Uncharacterized protein n=1 Tax=Stylosanthes scabra TaxID=79078 RepID=A0ABU6SV92_9FABA|nr:hypothetical protein [Stylosanthes scabra]
MCNDKDRGDQALIQADDRRGEDSKGKIKKGKWLRNTPPQMRKKKRKESVKFFKKGRKHEEGSSKGKFEEDKARKKIELKCCSVDDLISKLKAFKGAFHNNKSLNSHLVQDNSKWKNRATVRPHALVYAAARALRSILGGLCPGRAPHDPTTPPHGSKIPFWMLSVDVAPPHALCVPSHEPHDCAVPRASSWWDELLLAKVATTGARPRATVNAIARGPKKAEWAPNQGEQPCDGAVSSAA